MVRKGAELTVGEVAEKLGGVHTETVRRYLRDGLLRGRRLPKGHRRIEAVSVDELIAAMDLPEGPEQQAALDALMRRNRGETESAT